MGGRVALVEGGDRDRRDARMLGDGAAEGHIVAGEAERGEIGGDEIAAIGGQRAEAEARRPASRQVALGLQVVGERGEIGVGLGQAHRDGALQIGRRW